MRSSEEPFFEENHLPDPASMEQQVPEEMIFVAEVAPEPVYEYPRSDWKFSPRQIIVAGVLFGATCLTTFLAGLMMASELGLVLRYFEQNLTPPTPLVWQLVQSAGSYALAIMVILTAHEAGHFLQARRYGVWTSLPYFIPIPTMIGTMGAVISMDARVPNRKVLFDIGITGPLAGLIPTLFCCVWGLSQAKYAQPAEGTMLFGDPLVFRWLAHLLLGPQPPGHEILLNPVLFAGWVGLLITSLNLLPIGQLDGGHVLYALLGRKARGVAQAVLAGATLLVLYTTIRYHNPGWMLMVILLYLIGPGHPPTYQDHIGVGPVRRLLGWLMLAFIFIGLTPMPVVQT